MKSHPAGATTASSAGSVPGRQMEELGADEALQLLGSAELGRIVFTRHALPAVRPVNHVLDAGDIIVRVQDGSTLAALLATRQGTGVVVAYEADDIDPGEHLGWSVVATGYATAVTDPDEIERYVRLLEPWAVGSASGAIRIRPDLITGFRLREGGP
ncbi:MULTISPECIES: pyridoxamine 5'-phosphate oxidase family protein [unclassified Streptomyces]|uniref:pyridoxamine 5'-phosphate oxidase family protein n=1 Tax=unclassified Streptomyces TaxID=2593676 RepID=UPI0006200C0A|nr:MULTISPECIES: pyridoxamine 5'-phosphate oxidase family protein [unclassified Streptomyces]KJY30505.1 pyridoxamine 5'-phosphate oxidase [Streptomyces sp. NRRL S-444]KOY56969.1 pyridoxamine 5'-phosphate oxidase [Streptomyces sp. XY332]THA41507.1 pyridoxamine 5'-phosphate oxidase family protein [Streptomyces sp. A1547]